MQLVPTLSIAQTNDAAGTHLIKSTNKLLIIIEDGLYKFIILCVDL